MSALLKNQILKPLSRFAKNLSPDKLKLSAIKGEGDLTNLELDENALMELLDLPTWLLLKKAVCNRVSVKIQWTKLKSQPIVVLLDNVFVEIEALEEPRVPHSGPVPSYRAGSGKYGVMDRVLDGVRISVNSVRIVFTARAFKASVELSRLVVASKMPNWRDAELQYTSLRDPSRDAILLFKEIVWETTRIEADGLQDLQVTPVKLIANTSRIRITLKKRLSDCAILSSQLQLMLDDLLWVLTVSQLEAAVLFLKSLKMSIVKSAQQSKFRAEEKIKRQTGVPRSASSPHLSEPSVPNSGSSSNRTRTPQHHLLLPSNQNSNKMQLGGAGVNNNAALLFDRFDIPETSYHVHTGRVELHFCEEGNEGSRLSRNAVASGAIRLILSKIDLDFYPFHPNNADRSRWFGYTELGRSRDDWIRLLHQHQPPTSHKLSIPIANGNHLAEAGSSNRRPSNGFSNISTQQQRRLMESVFVLRLNDLQMSCVSTIKRRKPDAFIGSDKELLKLAKETTTLAFDFTEYYYSDSSTDASLPPANLFCQVNPVHIRIDAETVVWLNAFLLILVKNLQELTHLLASSTPVDPFQAPPNLRIEALMPRIEFPAEFDISGQPERPTVLQVQVSSLLIQSVRQRYDPILAAEMTAALDCYGEQVQESGQQLNFPRRSEDVQMDWTPFTGMTQPTPEKSNHTGDEEECIWYISCRQLWIEFMGAKMARNRPQPFLDSVPLILWCHTRQQQAHDPDTTMTATAGTRVSLLVDCKSTLSFQFNHYQLLFLNRFIESITRLSQQMTEDQLEIMAGNPGGGGGMRLAVACRLEDVNATMVMPALAEALPTRESVANLMRQQSGESQEDPACLPTRLNVVAFGPTMTAYWGSGASAVPTDGPGLAGGSSSEGAITPSSTVCPDLACCHSTRAPCLDSSPEHTQTPQVPVPPTSTPTQGQSPARVRQMTQQQQGIHAALKAAFSPPTQPEAKGLLTGAFKAFHFSAMTRIGEKMKATVTSSASSVQGDEDGMEDWEQMTTSELSDSDDGNQLEILMQDLDTMSNRGSDGIIQGYPTSMEFHGAGSGVHGGSFMAAGDEVEMADEAALLDDLQSVVSSVTSRGRDVTSTVSFKLTGVDTGFSMTEERICLSITIADCAIKESGAPHLMDTHSDHRQQYQLPLLALRLDIPMTPVEPNQHPPPIQVEGRVLRPYSIRMLMSSLVNLGDLVEDEVFSEVDKLARFVFDVSADVELNLVEDRPCTNLTCPGEHAKIQLHIPAGISVKRGDDSIIRLLPTAVCVPAGGPVRLATAGCDTRLVAATNHPSNLPIQTSNNQGLYLVGQQVSLADQLQQQQIWSSSSSLSSVHAGASLPGGLPASLPSASSSMGTAPACTGTGGVAATPTNSQELLTRYYQENVKLRDKVTSLRTERDNLSLELTDLRNVFEEIKRERDALAMSLEKVHVELQTSQNITITTANNNNSNSSSSSSSIRNVIPGTNQMGQRLQPPPRPSHPPPSTSHVD